MTIISLTAHHPSSRPTIGRSLGWNESPSNIPGKLYIGLNVTVPVNGASAPHWHGGASVAATVIKGRVLNQMVCADGHVVGPNIYEAGESWYEAPGCHHVRSENAGEEEALFVAAFVIDAKTVEEKGFGGALVQYDADLGEGEDWMKKG